MNNPQKEKHIPSDDGPPFPRFRETAIPVNLVAELLDSPRDTMAWYPPSLRWIVVRSEAGKQHLESATSLGVHLSSAPVVLICLADTAAWKSAPTHLRQLIADRKITDEKGREVLSRLRAYYSASPDTARRTALANAFIAAHQVLAGAARAGVTGCLVTAFDEVQIKTHFHVPDQFQVAALVPLGYGEGAPTAGSWQVSRATIYEEKFGETV